MPNLRMIIIFKLKSRNPTRGCRNPPGTGLCEKCRSCIIYWDNCNLSIRVSVRMALCTVIDHAVNLQTADFTAQMSPELHVQMKRWAGAAAPLFPPGLWKCLDEARCSACSWCFALLYKLWLFFPPKLRAEVTEIPVSCECPWPIQASFCSTRLVHVQFFLLFRISSGVVEVIDGWMGFGLMLCGKSGGGF